MSDSVHGSICMNVDVAPKRLDTEMKSAFLQIQQFELEANQTQGITESLQEDRQQCICTVRNFIER